MAITVINGASGTVNNSPIFSASVDDGIDIQQSAVLNGSRMRPVSFLGVAKGSASVSAPPNAPIVATAIAQMVNSPTPITVSAQEVGGNIGVSLNDALCTSLALKVDEGEVTIDLSFEGADVVPATVAATAPTPVAIVRGQDVTLSGAITGCALDLNVSVTTSYEKKTCVGSAFPSAAIGGVYEVKGSTSFLAAMGSSALTPGGDLVIAVGTAFTLTIRNIILKTVTEIGSTGMMKKVEFTGIAGAAEDAFGFT